MDPQLAQRFDVYASLPGSSEAVNAAVRAEVEQFQNPPLTDDQAGMFVSHAIAALNRLLAGESLPDGPSARSLDEAVRIYPMAPAEAAAMNDRFEERLGQRLPTNEENFLALHLALIIHNQRKAS